MIMDFSKAIEVLKYFNQNVDQLQGFSFWKHFPSKSGINITWDYSNKEVSISSKLFGPDDESISAFVLKYRLFIQDKDDISLRNINKLYEKLLIEKIYCESFGTYRNNINNILDKPSNVQIKNHKVTIREIHDMFIYGVWAHLNENDLNRKNYLGIKDDPIVYTMFANDFNIALVRIMNELVQIKFLNEKVIKILLLDAKIKTE